MSTTTITRCAQCGVSWESGGPERHAMTCSVWTGNMVTGEIGRISGYDDASPQETSPMTMRERMARAMCEVMGVDPDEKPTELLETLPWVNALKLADAALDALLEPTEEMEDDGLEAICGGIVCCNNDDGFLELADDAYERFKDDVEKSRAADDGVPSDIVLTFQAMIRAAKEGK